jgi:pentapeptide repeat protein
VWGDERKPGIGDQLVQRIARFEEGSDGETLKWIGGPVGLMVGVLLLIPVAGMAVLFVALAFGGTESEAETAGSAPFGKVAFGGLVVVIAGVTAYWRRQRLAAHFEAASRLVTSDDAGKRQRGLTELIMNARRGRAEHRRIAGALAAYLRRPPIDHPEEGGRRQLVFSLLADYTLSPAAKERIDLSGASLTGLRAVDAELPGVCLRGADLGNVRFVRANLANANLEDARIEGADFTGARLEGTILASTAPPRR